MQDVPLGVSENLDLDVLGLFEVFLQKNLPGDSVEPLAVVILESPVHVMRAAALEEASAASGIHRFEHHGKAHARGDDQGRNLPLYDVDSLRGNHPDAGVPDRSLGHPLVAGEPDYLRGWTDESDSGLLAGQREIGIFRKEPVPGMDGLYAVLPGRFDDLLDIAVISSPMLPLAQADPVLRRLHGQRVLVRLGINDRPGDIQGVARLDDSHRGDPSIGYEHFYGHGFPRAGRE